MAGITTTTRIQREIHPGMFWIQECVDSGDVLEKWQTDPPDWYEPGRAVHFTVNAFLLRGEETLLFETLSHGSGGTIVDLLRETLRGDPLDYVAVSHGEALHAANVGRVLDAFPEATPVAFASDSPEFDSFPLADARLVEWGDTLDLGEFVLDVIEPAFPDTAMTLWLYERETGTLFPVDWLGIPHTDAECGLFADELDTGMTTDRLAEFHGRALSWLEFADPEKTAARIEELIETYDPSTVAPSHGLVVREDAAEIMRRVQPAIERIAARGSDTFNHPFDSA